MLKRWMAMPLKELLPINERLDIVEHFVNNSETLEMIDEQIKVIGDLERLASKIAVGRINPREIVQLKIALETIDPIKEVCFKTNLLPLIKIAEQLNPCKTIALKIEKEIVPDPPSQIGKGNVFAAGVNAELDELKEIQHSGKDYLLKLQQRESDRTGISSLKVSFNNVFGYYIEISNANKDKVPDNYIRKQTLVNG